jgi:hypothetical protein
MITLSWLSSEFCEIGLIFFKILCEKDAANYGGLAESIAPYLTIGLEITYEKLSTKLFLVVLLKFLSNFTES